MGYLAVVIALAALTVKGYCGKKIGCYMRGTGDAFLFNLLRMLFCILIGLALVFAEGARSDFGVEPAMLLICLFSGFSNALFLVAWLLAVQKNAMVSLDVGMTMGSLIPAMLCAVLFAEPISLPKLLGFALILIATVILAGYSKQTVGKGGVMGIILLLLTVLGDGLCGFAQQLYKQYYTEAGSATHGVFYSKSIFHFYTYVFAALTLLLVWVGYRLILGKKKNTARPVQGAFASVTPTVLLMIFVMAICLFASNYLQTVATNDCGMSSQVLYPMIKGGCLVTVNVTAMLFFGEKITRRSALGSLIALIGIVCMSVL